MKFKREDGHHKQRWHLRKVTYQSDINAETIIYIYIHIYIYIYIYIYNRFFCVTSYSCEGFNKHTYTHTRKHTHIHTYTHIYGKYK